MTSVMPTSFSTTSMTSSTPETQSNTIDPMFVIITPTSSTPETQSNTIDSMFVVITPTSSTLEIVNSQSISVTIIPTTTRHLTTGKTIESTKPSTMEHSTIVSNYLSLSTATASMKLSTTPLKSESPRDEVTNESSIVIVLVAVIVGLVVLVFILILVIVLGFITRRCLRKPQHDAELNNKYESKETTKPKNSDLHRMNDYRLGILNPIALGCDMDNGKSRISKSSIAPTDNGGHYEMIQTGYYEEIEIKSSMKDGISDDVTSDNTGPQTPIRIDEGAGLYELIDIPVAASKVESSEQECVKKDEPNSSIHVEVEEEAGSTQHIPVYSEIQKETPAVPQKSVDLQIYLTQKSSMKDGHSDDVTSDKAGPQAPIHNDDGAGLYELIDIPVTTTAASTVESSEQECVKKNEPNCPIAEEEVGSTQHIPVYSEIQKKKAPAVPQKSVELQIYLTIFPSFNENVYSENINPSDFTHGGSQESEEMDEEKRDPQFYGPIYTVSTVLPEGFQEPLQITSDNIKEKKELGIGNFGQVILATTNGLSLKDMQLSKRDENQDISIPVAVKKLKPNPSHIQQEAFNKETKFMSQVRHPNVVRILGVCNHDPAFVMMEYVQEGDLYQFLQRFTEILETPSNNTQISTSTVVYMASQIASAMKYLASLEFIHRDIATRSCLVGTNFTVKVADLGINLKHYQSHYYQVQGNRLLPIRWMATECFSGKFSEKSDVWAFGVTMWELFSLAKDKPYPHLSDEEVIQNALKRRYNQFPSKSEACPLPVYEIMEKCWIIDMKNRATFHDLHEMLREHL